MPKFVVKVEYTLQKDISVFTDNEDDAKEKAVNIVLRWNDVQDAEAIDCDEL